MVVPDEFVYVAQCFYQGSSAEVSSMEEWVALALSFSNKQKQAVVKRFLQELLAQDLTRPSCSGYGTMPGPTTSFPTCAGC
jgi:hypothetical protein